LKKGKERFWREQKNEMSGKWAKGKGRETGTYGGSKIWKKVKKNSARRDLSLVESAGKDVGLHRSEEKGVKTNGTKTLGKKVRRKCVSVIGSEGRWKKRGATASLCLGFHGPVGTGERIGRKKKKMMGELASAEMGAETCIVSTIKRFKALDRIRPRKDLSKKRREGKREGAKIKGRGS